MTERVPELAMPSHLKKILSTVGLYRPARYLANLPYRQLTEYQAQINGVRVRFNTRDPRSNAWFYPRYRSGRLHEAPITRLLVAELQGKQSFVDIGAHIGWYACIAATLFPDLRVTAFEMDDSTADLLQANAALNSNTIDIRRMALTDTIGSVSYACPTNRPFSENRIEPSGSATNQTQCTSLDAFSAENAITPDIIKIDVEGAEFQTLNGMAGIIEQNRPTVFVEVHPENMPLFNSRPEDVTKFFSKRGYELSSVSHKSKPNEKQPQMLVARPR